MQLPDNSVGPTDIISYRECARRMSFGMRRHTGKAEQSDQRTPETALYGSVWARGYGSAIHTAIEAVEDGYDDEAAVQAAWDAHGDVLEPSDVDLLRDDIVKYRERDAAGMRTVLSEGEIRVPLLVYEGTQIYFRTRIDRLYERLDAPGTFLHVDWKSSKWAKSEKDVHEDLQLWMTNWAVHEYLPECERLNQVYDQLRYGQLPTHKSVAQRRQIHDWMVKQVTAILGDDRVQDDGLLPYKLNQWCQWCPILESCGVVADLTEFSLVRIAALAPQEKVGRKMVVDINPNRIEEYVEALPQVKQAIGILERFQDSLKDLLRSMPQEDRLEYGYKLRERTDNVFTPAAAGQIHAELGERFYELVKITRSSLELNLSDEPDLLEWALALAERKVGAASVVPA